MTMHTARTILLAATLPLVAAAGMPGQAAAAIPTSLSGSWAMRGSGPAGLVAAGGRIATLQVRQRGGALTIAIRSGTRTYAAAGTYDYPKPSLRFSWRMPAAGTVRFTGSVQAGGSRAIGNWIDDHGDDGGVVLIRLR